MTDQKYYWSELGYILRLISWFQKMIFPGTALWIGSDNWLYTKNSTEDLQLHRWLNISRSSFKLTDETVFEYIATSSQAHEFHGNSSLILINWWESATSDHTEIAI